MWVEHRVRERAMLSMALFEVDEIFPVRLHREVALRPS